MKTRWRPTGSQQMADVKETIDVDQSGHRQKGEMLHLFYYRAINWFDVNSVGLGAHKG